MSHFRVSPQQLAKTSQEMAQLSETYTTIYKHLLQEVFAMGSAWEGADNLAFIAQINGCCDDLKMMAEKLMLASQALDKQQSNYVNRQQDIITQAQRL